LNFALDSSVANNPSYAQLLRDARESFAITMPGGISSHSGGTVSGDTITYTVHVDQVANIDVASSAVNVVAVLPVIGGGVVIVVILAAMLFVYRKRVRATDESAVAASAPEGVAPDAATPMRGSREPAPLRAQTAPNPADATTLTTQDDEPERSR
jgi:hypothetical protein